MSLRTLTGGLVHTPLLEGLPNLISDRWRQFFADSTRESNLAAAIATVEEENTSAALPLTPIPVDGELDAGLYRVTVYTKIKTPASVNSSVTPSITFTDGTDVCTFTGTANTGNTATSVQSNTWLIHITAGTPISYQTAYVSNLAGMAYDVRITLEQIG